MGKRKSDWKASDKLYLIESVWHWLIEDGCRSWRFLAGVLGQNYGIEITPSKLKTEFVGFFEAGTGYKVFSKCPQCGNGEIVPRVSRYGYFVSCSEFPRCDFKGRFDRSVFDE